MPARSRPVSGPTKRSGSRPGNHVSGIETDHRTIPHELGWIGPAVHLDKGCYRGQETVARVQNLGRPPRRLVLLHLSGETDELPPPGTPVAPAGVEKARPIGFLGTAVHHWEDGPIALAVIKRQIADDAELQVGPMTARIDTESTDGTDGTGARRSVRNVTWVA